MKVREKKKKKREQYLILYIKICIHTSYHIIYSFLFIPHSSSLIPHPSLFPPPPLLSSSPFPSRSSSQEGYTHCVPFCVQNGI